MKDNERILFRAIPFIISIVATESALSANYGPPATKNAP